MIGQRIQAFDIVFEPAVGVNCFADIITTERGQRIAITAGPLVPQNARSGPEQSQIPVIPPIPAYAERVSILPHLVHHDPDAHAELDKMIDQPREYPEHRVIGAEEKRPDIIRKSINLTARVQAATGTGRAE